MDGDRDGWIKGLRLTLVACVSAVVAAMAVIQIGTGVIQGRAASAAQAPLILTAR